MAIYSNSLKRVLKYTSGWFKREPVYSGFYMSNDQLIELGESLKNYGDNTHPDGVCFMVGKFGTKYTVEMIPYIDTKADLKRSFYDDGAWLGFLGLSLQPATPDSDPFFINSNDAAAGGGTTQRTPPPRTI